MRQCAEKKAMKRFIISLSLMLAAQAAATPQNAHYHYMVGARANAAMNFAKQLHYEAVQPGDFHLQLARTNAADLERLAREIQEWVSATEKANSPEQNAKIESQLKRIREEAQRLEKGSTELGTWIDQAVAAGSKADEALRAKIGGRARDLFQGFRRIMAAHKEAEEILGIPTPEDPPAAN
jgi:hypothetical protein